MRQNSTQRAWVIDALLDAFPRYTDFKYMIAIELGENIETIVSPGSNLKACVFELVIHMEAQGRLKELLLGALRQNPSNSALLQCSTRLDLIEVGKTDKVSYQSTSAGVVSQGDKESSSTSSLPQHLRTALVTDLLRLPGIQQPERRDSLLHILPSAHTLDRNNHNTKQDLIGIIDQLSHLGQTSSYQWPIILLLDTAIEDVRGYTLEEDLQRLKQQLIEHYGEI